MYTKSNSPVLLLIIVIVVLVAAGGIYTYSHNSQPAIVNETHLVNPSPAVNNQVATTTRPLNQTLNSPSETSKSSFSSPQAGATYNFGDTVLIKWDPTLIDASTIRLNCADGTKCSGAYQIYRRDNINDPVSKDGSFSYVLPSNYTGPVPGKYRVLVYSYGDKTSLESAEFTILPPPETAPQVKNPAYIQQISGQKSKYNPGEAINLFVDARDWNTDPASPDRGFNIQAHIFDANNYPGPSFQAVNASYDTANSRWIIQMTAPTDKSLVYNLQISLYCGYVGLSSSPTLGMSSVCAQEHGDNNQIDQSVSFTIN